MRLDPESWVGEISCRRGCCPKRKHDFHPGPDARGKAWVLLTTAAWPPGLDGTESYAIWTSNMSSSGLLISGGREQDMNSLESWMNLEITQVPYVSSPRHFPQGPPLKGTCMLLLCLPRL